MSHEQLGLEMEITQDGLGFVIAANGTTFILDCDAGEWWVRDIERKSGVFSKTFRTRKSKKFALLKAIDFVLSHLANDNLMVEVSA